MVSNKSVSSTKSLNFNFNRNCKKSLLETNVFFSIWKCILHSNKFLLIQRPDRDQKQKTFGSAEQNCTFEMKQKIKRVTAFKDELSPVSRTIFLHLRSLTLILSTLFNDSPLLLYCIKVLNEMWRVRIEYGLSLFTAVAIPKWTEFAAALILEFVITARKEKSSSIS